MCCHKWITIIYGRVQIDFGSEQPQPQPTLSLPAPRQSNNSTQYGALRRRATATLAALKTVKPYYGNRYQISLSNRFCHPMKNCWQQGSVWVTIWNTVLDLNDQTHISYDMNGSVDKKCEEESILCYYGSSLCLCHWVSRGSQFPERHSSSTWGGERKIESQSLPQC